MEKKAASEILLTLLLTSMLTLAFNIQPAKAAGTIYIRADGSIDPPTAPISTADNVTYTFTDNIYDSIVVERDDIVVDGAGYTVTGSGSGEGITLAGRSNVTVRNMTIKNFNTGIQLDSSSSNTLSGNNVTADNGTGIYLSDSSDNTLSGNKVTNNLVGIWLEYSSKNNVFYHNNFINSTQHVQVMTPSYANSWDDGYPSGGNYWSDYNGTDSNNDGIGDTPYVIDAQNQDNYPLVHPYGSVRNLNTSLTYLTVQSAINAPETLNGHTILVEPGTYHEQLTVNKTLSIIGSGSESTTISGSPSDCAVEIAADNVELSGFTICGGGFGLKVYSHNNNVHDNSIVENGFIGIYLYLSSGNTFTSNNVSRNGYGVSLVHSGGNAFKHNSIFDNEWQELVIEGNTVSNFVEDMDTSNSVDSKPVYYWVNQQDKIVPSDAGYVALVDCRRILVQNLTFNRNGQGVLLAGTTDSMIENNALSTEYYGIYMVDSSNVTIRNCTIANCNFAMEIWSSNGNKIIGNNIVSNAYGVELAWSNYNNVSGNTIEQTSEYNGWGVCLSVSATGNQIYENDFAHNSQGMNIQLFYPGENKMYHNNFIQNAIQVYNYEPAINVWDDGYPSGGNYWSDYTGVDNHSGPDQNETGTDGIGDTPHLLDAANQDNYPLMKPYGGPYDIGILSIDSSKTVVGQGYNLTIKLKVLNYGIGEETFDLTVSANKTAIHAQTITLASRNSTTITFTWNTTGFAYGNYTISVVADPVPGETYTADNTFIYGEIAVTILGDINGDKFVNIKDAVSLNVAFGSQRGQPSYSPNADINGDGYINIKDAVSQGTHFGEHWE